MATKTCMQDARDAQARPVKRRRAHVILAGASAEYVTCSACGAEVYVPQSAQSAAFDRAEREWAVRNRN